MGSRRPVWRKSSYSSTQGGECVEVADLSARVIGIQDSKNPGPHLTISAAAFGRLVEQLKQA